MKLLLYSINYSPELTGIGKCNGDMVAEISAHNVETHVITAPPYYPEWKLHKGFKNWWSTEQAGGVTVYRCPLYIPKFPTAFKRILHLISFAKSSGFRLFSLFKLKPDVVFLVQPTLFCAPAALIYCKLTGAKSILHIQDFEVDAMFG
ncbi:MAG: colanic acid biosynthesis glycosyltransferase WcaI, partial [Aureispira sp.]|nr:colanic acid biosynthesis glycosyltransferase WcaI [Aureispira sp.]